MNKSFKAQVLCFDVQDKGFCAKHSRLLAKIYECANSMNERTDLQWAY